MSIDKARNGDISLENLPFDIGVIFIGLIAAFLFFNKGLLMLWRSKSERKEKGWKWYDLVVYVLGWMIFTYTLYYPFLHEKQLRTWY